MLAPTDVWSTDMLERTELLCRSGSFDLDWASGRMTLSAGLRALLGLADTAAVQWLRPDALQWVPAQERAFVAGVWQGAAPDDPFAFQHRVQCTDGSLLVVLHRGVLATTAGGGRRGIACLQDITAQRQAGPRIQDRASQAGATGLPDHASLPVARRDLQLEAALRSALASQELSLRYNPQVDLADGRLCGAKAVLRWQCAALGEVAPAEFLPLAERTGWMGAISDWMLREVCQQQAAWQRAGLRRLRIAVNLSSAQLSRPDLVRQFAALVAETGADPSCLGVEITEAMLSGDLDQAAGVLRGLRLLGTEVVLAAFGTGSSSLAMLSRLPIDVVKVDRSLVQDVTAPAQQVSVTRAIIHMAHGLQMKVLAAGVQSEGQLHLLVGHGCDRMQGAWFSKPLPAEDFAALQRADGRLPQRFIARTPGARTLLLVDDEENIVSALKRLLRRDGYTILTAHSAAEGLLRLAEQPVDVIVSDQRMPGMTGVEFLRRAKDLYPDTVRMVLSGYTELQSIIDAVNEGAIYRFLTKPWDDQRLRDHVAEAFRQKNLADDNRALARQVATANGDLDALNQRLNKLLQRQRDDAALLGASADGMRGMLDDLPAAVLGIDPEGAVAYANLAAERLLPAACGLLGQPLADVLPMADLDAGPAHALVELAGQTFQVERSELTGAGGTRGRLLVLVLMPPAGQPALRALPAPAIADVEGCR